MSCIVYILNEPWFATLKLGTDDQWISLLAIHESGKFSFHSQTHSRGRYIYTIKIKLKQVAHAIPFDDDDSQKDWSGGGECISRMMQCLFMTFTCAQKWMKEMSCKKECRGLFDFTKNIKLN